MLDRLNVDNAKVQAARVLKKIASGTSDHTRAVIDAGAVPILVRLLLLTHDDLCEQAMLALSEIACNSTICRDIVLQV